MSGENFCSEEPQQYRTSQPSLAVRTDAAYDAATQIVRAVVEFDRSATATFDQLRDHVALPLRILNDVFAMFPPKETAPSNPVTPSEGECEPPLSLTAAHLDRIATALEARCAVNYPDGTIIIPPDCVLDAGFGAGKLALIEGVNRDGLAFIEFSEMDEAASVGAHVSETARNGKPRVRLTFHSPGSVMRFVMKLTNAAGRPEAYDNASDTMTTCGHSKYDPCHNCG